MEHAPTREEDHVLVANTRSMRHAINVTLLVLNALEEAQINVCNALPVQSSPHQDIVSQAAPALSTTLLVVRNASHAQLRVPHA